MIEKPSKVRAVILAGTAMGVVSSIPGLNLINCCCCAGIILGGMLAAYLYKEEWREDMPPLEASDGLVLGILAGIVGAFTSTVLSMMILLLFGAFEAELVRAVAERVLQALEESGSLPAGFADELLEQLDEGFASASTAIGILGSLLVNLILYPIFGMLGGLIGYGLFKPKPSVPSAPMNPRP